MDEVVFGLFSRRKVRQDMFDTIEKDGFYLNKIGKELLIDSINNRFEEKIRYKGRMIKLNNIIQFDCHDIAKRVMNEVI